MARSSKSSKKTATTIKQQKKRRSYSSTQKSNRKKSQKKDKKESFYLRTIFFIAVLILLVGAGLFVGEHLDEVRKEPLVEKGSRVLTPSIHSEGKKKISLPVKKDGLSKKMLKSKTQTVKQEKRLTQLEKKKAVAAQPILSDRKDRAKLVIIIDDVHTQVQLDAITSLPFPVTPSIFPPYTQSPYTPKLATRAVHYMVHLPMESGNAKYDKQSKTLMRSANKKVITTRMKEIRKLFPRAHYINNHTGSRFSEDCHAMSLLYHAMRKEGFAFIDSLTTPKSCVKKVVHAEGGRYLYRSVFLDNTKQIGYIHRQLKKAVSLAKKHGYAIVIGHPHKVTLRALKQAKWLLDEVEVVYIDELF